MIKDKIDELTRLKAERRVINKKIRKIEHEIGLKYIGGVEYEANKHILSTILGCGGVAPRTVIAKNYNGKSLDVYLKKLKDSGKIIAVGRGVYKMAGQKAKPIPKMTHGKINDFSNY